MSLGKSIVKMVRERAVEALSNRGFSLVSGVPDEAYSSDHGAIVRYFSPYYSIRSNGINISGKIGIFLPEFETQWEAQDSSKSKHVPFGMLIDNCRALIHIPTINIETFDQIRPWISLIADETEKLPNDIEELRNNIRSGFLGNYPLNFFYLPNEKSTSAVRWILSQ